MKTPFIRFCYIILLLAASSIFFEACSNAKPTCVTKKVSKQKAKKYGKLNF